jgi:hypothetical protein
VKGVLVTPYETVAVPAPLPDAPPDYWPATWAEVPGERFERDGVTFAVVSVPAGTEDARIRGDDLAPMRCEGGNIWGADGVIASCAKRCPGSRGLYPVELAGRESCPREPVYPETQEP